MPREQRVGRRQAKKASSALSQGIALQETAVACGWLAWSWRSARYVRVRLCLNTRFYFQLGGIARGGGSFLRIKLPGHQGCGLLAPRVPCSLENSDCSSGWTLARFNPSLSA